MQRTHIRANQPWWTIDWKEIAEYRDLLWFLIRRDFATVYKQSILGPLWFVIQPLSTTLVFTTRSGWGLAMAVPAGWLPGSGLPPLCDWLCCPGRKCQAASRTSPSPASSTRDFTLARSSTPAS